MTRIAGLPQTASERAFDMYLKVRHVQSMNGGGGVVFATGTPIANSMAEMFTMQRYLQPDELKNTTCIILILGPRRSVSQSLGRHQDCTWILLELLLEVLMPLTFFITISTFRNFAQSFGHCDRARCHPAGQ